LIPKQIQDRTLFLVARGRRMMPGRSELQRFFEQVHT